MTMPGPIPNRVALRPRDHRGFIVPWFVAWMKDGFEVDEGEGVPDFRVIASNKLAIALNYRRCWICGEPMGQMVAYAIGPMCAATRTTSEPGNHRTCAEWAVKVCPFLSRPKMRRNEKALPDAMVPAAGDPIDRNPGVMALWITKGQGHKPFRPHAGNPGVLLQLADPVEVTWWREGRPATRAEVQESIDSGAPVLWAEAKREGPEAERDLVRCLGELACRLPHE